MASTQFCTLVLSGSAITFVEKDYVVELTLQVTTGTVNVTGNRSFRGTNNSVPIPLSSGGTITLSAKDGQYPIDGVTVDASGGTAIIMLSF